MNSNLKGRLALTKAIEYYTSQGYIISIPLNDEQFYDIVIEKDGRFTPVQCKFTGYKNPNNPDVYSCPLRTIGGNGKVYRRVNEESGLLFVMTKEKRCYSIPIEKIKNRNSIRLFLKTPKVGFDTSVYLIE